MRSISAGRLMVLILLLGIFIPVAHAAEINSLADSYWKATDLKRSQINNEFFGKSLLVKGIVSNVEAYNLFNEKTDTVLPFYRVTLEQQRTPDGSPYQIILLYSDLEKVNDLARGEKIEKESEVVRIVDERLQEAIWLYAGELTPQDRELFKTVFFAN